MIFRQNICQSLIFWQKFWFFDKNFDFFGQNLDFWKNIDFYQKFRSVPKISTFTKSFDFYQKFRFLPKSFDFYQKLRFLPKVSIFDEKPDFWPKKCPKFWKKINSGNTPISGHLDEVYSVDWSPDGQKVASGGKDKALRLWRKWKKGNRRKWTLLRGHESKKNLKFFNRFCEIFRKKNVKNATKNSAKNAKIKRKVVRNWRKWICVIDWWANFYKQIKNFWPQNFNRKVWK